MNRHRLGVMRTVRVSGTHPLSNPHFRSKLGLFLDDNGLNILPDATVVANIGDKQAVGCGIAKSQREVLNVPRLKSSHAYRLGISPGKSCHEEPSWGV